MRIKIGNKIYDGGDEPVMVILTDQDKENIANMAPDAYRYAEFPEEWNNEEQMREWMRDEPT